MSIENEIEVDNTDENSPERNETGNVNVITEKLVDVTLDDAVNDEITPSTSSQIVQNSMSPEIEIEVNNTDENSLERNETENVNVITEKLADVRWATIDPPTIDPPTIDPPTIDPPTIDPPTIKRL